MLMAAQMQALRKSYIKSNVDKQIVSPVYVACAEKERKQSAVWLLNVNVKCSQRINAAYGDIIELMSLFIGWWAKDVDFQLEPSSIDTYTKREC